MKYISAALLPILFFTLTYASASNEFSHYDLAFILVILTIAIGAQLLFARLFARFRAFQNLLLAGFTLINIASLHLNLNTAFLNLPAYLAAIALLVGVFILFTLFNVIDDIPRAGPITSTALFLTITGLSLNTLYVNQPIQWPTPPRGQTTAPNVQLVDFVSTPNVYFVVFDALAPQATLSKYLDIDTAPYLAALDSNFQPFSNFFADRVRTKKSLNSLLALDIEYFDNLENQNTRYGFFPGLTPSPLLEIFKHNGYETNTVHTGVYFGQQSGPYVDHYLTAKQVGVCDFVKIRRAFTFLGYCALLDLKPVQTALNRLDIVRDIDAGEFLLEKMTVALESSKPQLFISYLSSPGHVNWIFNYDNPKEVNTYRRQFLRHSTVTQNYIDDLINFISEHDPNAVLYIFGDHGMLLSHQLQVDDDPVFAIQDRFGVYGGIHSNNTCISSVPARQEKPFTTVSQAARMIVECLANGKDPFLTQRDYHLPHFGKANPHRYEDYLYE